MSARRKAFQAYVDFHGEAPTETLRYELPNKTVHAYRLGRTTALAYETTRDGRDEDYMHEFANGKGPFLDVATDGTVHLTEGDFDVTDRGFEDNFMPALLTINPHKRGTRRKKKAFPMAKRNSKGQFVKTAAKSKTRHRRKNPVKALRSRPTVVYQETKTIKRRRRRNPIGSRKGGINFMTVAVNGAAQGAGGLMTAMAVGMMPLSADMKTGPMGALLEIGTACAIGYGVGKFVNGKIGENVASGGVAWALFRLAQGFIPASIPMGAMSYNQDIPMGAIYDPGMGGYVYEENGVTYLLQQQPNNAMNDWQDMGFATPSNTVADVPRY